MIELTNTMNKRELLQTEVKFGLIAAVPFAAVRLETALSACLRRYRGVHLSPGSRGKRLLDHGTLVIVLTCHAATSSFDKDSGARKAPKYRFAICCETGSKRY